MKLKNDLISKCVLGLAVSLVSTSAICAGKADRFNVVSVRTDATGNGLVIFANDLVGTPASCAGAAFGKHLAFDATSPAGKAILSLALFAQGTGKKIFAMGKGACTVYGGTVEDWDYGWTLEE